MTVTGLHTLNEFMHAYLEAENIQLVFGDHLVNICSKSRGSYAIIRAFKDFTFTFTSYNEQTKFLVLMY